MSLLATLRQQALSKLFGDGASGVIAAAVAAWAADQAREALRRTPQLLDTTKLIPGETYTVRTRPPLDRSERRLTTQYESASRALAKLAQPSRAQMRVATRLAKAQRRADRRPGDLSRAVDAEVLGIEFDKLMAPTAKQQKLLKEVDRLDRELEARRAAALAAHRRHRRPPRARRFL